VARCVNSLSTEKPGHRETKQKKEQAIKELGPHRVECRAPAPPKPAPAATLAPDAARVIAALTGQPRAPRVGAFVFVGDDVGGVVAASRWRSG
jgi:hypothetical protein